MTICWCHIAAPKELKREDPIKINPRSAVFVIRRRGEKVVIIMIKKAKKRIMGLKSFYL